MFREFCVGGGQKGMAAPGIRALQCPVESSHVSTMTAYVSGGRVATKDTPLPLLHTLLGPAQHENIQNPSQNIEGINFQ